MFEKKNMWNLRKVKDGILQMTERKRDYGWKVQQLGINLNAKWDQNQMPQEHALKNQMK